MRGCWPPSREPGTHGCCACSHHSRCRSCRHRHPTSTSPPARRSRRPRRTPWPGRRPRRSGRERYRAEETTRTPRVWTFSWNLLGQDLCLLRGSSTDMNSGSVHAKKLEQHFLSARLATPHVQARHSARHMTKRAARIIRREMAHDSPPRAFSPSVVAAEPDAPPASFAYPDGYSTRRVRRSVRAAGFTQSLAVGKALARRRQGPYALERTT